MTVPPLSYDTGTNQTEIRPPLIFDIGTNQTEIELGSSGSV
jgi:hypothetical protein